MKGAVIMIFVLQLSESVLGLAETTHKSLWYILYPQAHYDTTQYHIVDIFQGFCSKRVSTVST